MKKQLEACHATLQRLREAARKDGRRADAQQIADTQWLVRVELKWKRAKKGKP